MNLKETTPTTGGFTLPGEEGYEALTLQLAKTWGADVIRDSDGTQLSDEILNAGYGIYSTICIIRGHNAWAKAHPEALQQTFLSTQPRLAGDGPLNIDIMADFFAEQFRPNAGPAALGYWQVYDRTTGQLLPNTAWQYAGGNILCIPAPEAYHRYTVSFLAYRIWEEISMYNHVTNQWEKEHLLPVDPRTPAAQAYLYTWLENWCCTHPDTTVVRFTSMFYNFAWIWGSNPRNQSLFSDWGSYDFTVSEQALADFEAAYGYALTAEDFINKGNLQVTHMPPDAHKQDYMRFTQKFVADFGAKLVQLVQRYGKKAYVFYDDSWVGVEPYGPEFARFGFDGIIKCVFSGFEVRLCSGVKTQTHELRLHPYLFPVGLGGAPTFAPGGDPTLDAKKYWNSVRRALLRVKIDRIGLGGYLHLVQDYPDFIAYIAKIADEFRLIKSFHERGAVYTLPLTVAVLHSWGSLRPWTLSGHFHETYMHDLIHINEALSGLPVQVKFISFEDVKNGGLAGVDVVLNAGRAGTAWSGGDAWRDPALVTALTGWVCRGGGFIGVGEPSAVAGYGEYFRMAGVLGIDRDTGARVCHGRWQYQVQALPGLIPAGAGVNGLDNLYLTDGDTTVFAEDAATHLPTITAHAVGKGRGVYLSSFQAGGANNRLLLNLLLYAAGQPLNPPYLTDNTATECAYYPAGGQLVLINNSATTQTATVQTEKGPVTQTLAGYDTKIIAL
ncbi:MAG: 1,3-beta-galactosyl-N-acetylhexosamine phosphorylase [Gemmiger sp.]|nr:1,3-beta-galactosyl-N-acetylhexosamine phosphorylase [Gemmiger sp.]